MTSHGPRPPTHTPRHWPLSSPPCSFSSSPQPAQAAEAPQARAVSTVAAEAAAAAAFVSRQPDSESPPRTASSRRSSEKGRSNELSEPAQVLSRLRPGRILRSSPPPCSHEMPHAPWSLFPVQPLPPLLLLLLPQGSSVCAHQSSWQLSIGAHSAPTRSERWCPCTSRALACTASAARCHHVLAASATHAPFQ